MRVSFSRLAGSDSGILPNHGLGNHQLADGVDQAIKPIGAHAHRGFPGTSPAALLGANGVDGLGGGNVALLDECLADALAALVLGNLFDPITFDRVASHQDVAGAQRLDPRTPR